MKIPFTVEQFLGVFKEYNTSVFPLQIIFNLTALLFVYIIFKRKNLQNFILPYLGFLWLWMGIVYHIIFFSSINKAAFIFGGLFILQGILFIYSSFKYSIEFNFTGEIRSISAVILILYSLLIYPLIGYLSGHGYPFSPTFGLPCPTTIFTFGILLLIDEKIPLKLIIIPLIWCVIGFNAALSLGIYEDIGLAAAGLISIIFLILVRFRKRQIS